MALARIDRVREDGRWFRALTAPLTFWHHIPWLYAGSKEFDREGYLECFGLILRACDVNVGGAFGRTVPHEVATMGDGDDEVAALGRATLEAGAHTDRRDDIRRSTALGWACRWGRAGRVRALLEQGADREERDAEPGARTRVWARKMGTRGFSRYSDSVAPVAHGRGSERRSMVAQSSRGSMGLEM